MNGISWILLILILLLALAAIRFLRKNGQPGCCGDCGRCASGQSCIGRKQNNKKYWRTAMIVVFLAIIGFLLYQSVFNRMPQLWQALKSGNEQDITRFLNSGSQVEGLFSLVLLQMLQVISIVIPSAPIRIAGGLSYGTLAGFVSCHLAYVAANGIVFSEAERLKVFVHSVFKNHIFKKERVAKLLREEDPFFAVMLACMIPLIPNGLIPYAAAETNLTIGRFLLAVYVGSAFPTLIMCAIGRRILAGDYLVAGVLLIVNLIIVFWIHQKRSVLTAAMQKTIKK